MEQKKFKQMREPIFEMLGTSGVPLYLYWEGKTRIFIDFGFFSVRYIRHDK